MFQGPKEWEGDGIIQTNILTRETCSSFSHLAPLFLNSVSACIWPFQKMKGWLQEQWWGIVSGKHTRWLNKFVGQGTGHSVKYIYTSKDSSAAQRHCTMLEETYQMADGNPEVSTNTNGVTK